MKLPPIDGKKKKDGSKKKEEYPEQVVIMDAEDMHKAIEGKKLNRRLMISFTVIYLWQITVEHILHHTALPFITVLASFRCLFCLLCSNPTEPMTARAARSVPSYGVSAL